VEVLLVFVNLFTTTILLGSFGVQTTLHPKPGKSGGQQGNPGLGFLIGMVVFAGQMAGTGGAGWLSKPWSSALLGLVTPVPILYGMGAGDPWGYGLWFFGGRVPFLLVSPVFHLALAALSLHSMARRMVNPQNPALSKPVAYLSLAVVDLLIAGVIYGDPRPGFGYQLAPAPRIALFCLLHLVATLVALFCVTPPRETLETWVWRYRGRMPLWRDWLIGERSENGLALVVCAAIGLLVGVLGVVLPCAPDEVQAVAGRIALCLGTTCLIILTYGTLLQWMVVVGKRQGMALFILAVVLANALPAGAGLYLKVQQEESGRKRGREVDPDEWNLLLEMSPAVQYGSWMADDRQLKQRPNPLPVLIPYAAALGLLYWDLRRRVRWLERRIDTKLEGMGIVPYAVAVEAG
jgi:hypothetical protein